MGSLVLAARRRLSGPRQLHLALLALALLVRLPFITYTGFFMDLAQYVSWGIQMQSHFWNVYSYGLTQRAQPQYPPLSEYLFGFLVGMYTHLTGSSASLPLDQAPVLTAFMKLPAILADLATVSVIYVVARRLLRPRWAFIAAASYALSPAAILIGAVWGQTDAVFTLCLLLALLATLRHKGLAAGILVGLSIMLKPQPLVLAPLIPVYLWRWSGARQSILSLAGIASVTALLCLPYLLPPHPELLIYRDIIVPRMLAAFPQSSVSGFNLWWLIGVADHRFDAPFIGPLSINALGWLCYAVALAVAIAGIWRDSSPARLYLSASLLWLTFFVFGAVQHERYLFPAIPLLLLTAICERTYVCHYLVVSLTAVCNAAYFAFAYLPGPYPSPVVAQAHQFFSEHWELTPVVALANVLLLCELAFRYTRTRRSQQQLHRMWQRPLAPVAGHHRPAGPATG